MTVLPIILFQRYNFYEPTLDATRVAFKRTKSPLPIFLPVGGVLVRPVEILEGPEEEPKCSELYGNCSVNEDCCDFMRCMDFGKIVMALPTSK